MQPIIGMGRESDRPVRTPPCVTPRSRVCVLSVPRTAPLGLVARMVTPTASLCRYRYQVNKLYRMTAAPGENPEDILSGDGMLVVDESDVKVDKDVVGEEAGKEKLLEFSAGVSRLIPGLTTHRRRVHISRPARRGARWPPVFWSQVSPGSLSPYFGSPFSDPQRNHSAWL